MMDTDLFPNVRGNVQTLRNMWSTKVQGEEKSLRPISIPTHPQSEQQAKKSPKMNIPTVKITNETIRKESPVTPNNEKAIFFRSVEKLPSIKEKISLPFPSSPPSTIFKDQAQTVKTVEQSINKMTNNPKKNKLYEESRNNGIHHWHITRHVFRSGLIFNRPRRASDSIIPLLTKTHTANNRCRADSVDSTISQTPFVNLVDFLTYDGENNKNCLTVSKKMKRSTSDTSDCIRRNKLDDLIYQYEMIFRHLKNYDQFMSTCPVTPSSSSMVSKQREKSLDHGLMDITNKAKEEFLAKSPITNRHTQSLSRNVGRTFSEFIMTDFLLPLSASSSNEQKRSSFSHASSQTDLSEPIHGIKDETNDSVRLVHSSEYDRINSVSNEEAKEVLNELDAMLDQHLPITPNSEINVVVLNSSDLPSVEVTQTTEKPLMQRLFEGKKTAYSPDDLNMTSIRLPEEMMPVYEIAKKKCFFESETLVYITKMLKVRRRSYTQHVRMLCITTERIYNITKKDPYPKEGLLFSEILGITCTPYKDGFICIHSKDSHEDRGDWLVVVDHPCEFITQLFMIMERENNDDHFLKFESKFTHCRRFYGESSSNDCTIEARLADRFRIKKADFDTVIIYTP